MKCFWCELDLIPAEAIIGPPFRGKDFAICKDRPMCRKRLVNAFEKEALLNTLERAESGASDLSEFISSGSIFDTALPCVLCGGRLNHQYHHALRCSWCNQSLGLIPTDDEVGKVVKSGWCPECRASWIMEIEKEMGR